MALITAETSEGAGSQEHGTLGDKLRVYKQPFRDMIIDPIPLKHSNHPTLAIASANALPGMIVLEEDVVTAIVPSVEAREYLSQSRFPVRFASLRIHRNGETIVENNLSLNASDFLANSVFQIDEGHARVIDAMLLKNATAAGPHTLAHAEVMSVLDGLANSTSRVTSLSQSAEFHDDAKEGVDIFLRMASIIGANRLAVEDRLFPRASYTVAPKGMHLTTDELQVSLALESVVDAKSSVVISASVTPPDFLQEVGHPLVTLNLISPDGSRTSYIVANDNQLYSSLGAATVGEVVQVTNHQDWIFGMVKTALVATAVAVKEQKPQLIHNSQVIIHGLEKVISSNVNNPEAPKESRSDSFFLLPEGWKYRAEIESFPANSSKVHFALRGEKNIVGARVELDMPLSEGQGFADMTISRAIGTNMTLADAFRINDDGSVQMWDKGHLCPVSQAYLATIRELITTGLIPVLKQRERRMIDVIKTIRDAIVIVTPPDIESEIAQLREVVNARGSATSDTEDTRRLRQQVEEAILAYDSPSSQE